MHFFSSCKKTCKNQCMKEAVFDLAGCCMGLFALIVPAKLFKLPKKSDVSMGFGKRNGVKRWLICTKIHKSYIMHKICILMHKNTPKTVKNEGGRQILAKKCHFLMQNEGKKEKIFKK